MLTALDVLKILFFPGIVFLTVCGGVLVSLEERLGVVMRGPRPTSGSGLPGRCEAQAPTPSGILSMVASLAAMGAGGVMLVGKKGDLLALALLFSGAELLPLALLAEKGDEGRARLPLSFRTAWWRLLSLISIFLCVALRFPEDFAAAMSSFPGEAIFAAAPLWSGAAFPLVVVSLALAALAALVLLLGPPAWETGLPCNRESAMERIYRRAMRGLHRSLLLAAFLLIFLGYPWKGGGGLPVWSVIAVAIALLSSCARAWVGSGGNQYVRKWQQRGTVLALISLAAMVFAVLLS